MQKLKACYSIITTVLMLTLFTVGCAGLTTEPTQDPSVIYTEAAITVAAQLTAAAPAATNTPEPTPIPTNTPIIPTNTPLPERPTETPETGPTFTPQPQPTATTSSSSNDLIDEAEMISFFPPDDQVYTSGGVFSAKVGFRNMGPNTWNSSYTMRFLSGNTFGVGSKYVMADFGTKDSVAPGEEVVFTIPNMTAPTEEGRYLSNWCLYNNREAQGLSTQCFYLVTFQIIVDNP